MGIEQVMEMTTLEHAIWIAYFKGKENG